MKRIIILVAVNVGFFSMTLSMDLTPVKGGTSDVTIEMTDPKGKSPVTLLDLTGATVQTPGGTTSRPKTPIKDFSDLTQVARSLSTKSTQRTSLKRSKRLDSPIPASSKVIKGASVKKTTSSGAPTDQAVSSVETALVQKAEQAFGVKIINGKKYYSEDDVWKKIETLSPIIYTFAQKQGMDLEQTIEFANEMKGVDISHQVFAQIAHGDLNPDLTAPSLWERTRNFLIGNPNRQAVSTESLNQEYEKLIKKNPNQYEVLACEALKAAYDLVEGKEQNRSPIADTHIGVQNKKINEQDATIRQQYLAMVLQLALTIGGWVLGILQTVSPTDCHHNVTA